MKQHTKQILGLFLGEFKMNFKAMEPASKIKNIFCQEMLMNIQYKPIERLEDNKHCSQILGVDYEQLRPVIKVDPLTTV